MGTRASLSLCILALCACREAPVAPAAPAPSPAVTLPSEVTLAAALAPSDPALTRVPLAERLQRESDLRPARAIHPEQLLAALAQNGLSLARKRQVLASTIGATYCELAVSGAGLGVSLCEFTSDEAARTGSERSAQLFDQLVPGRKLLRNHNSLLTVTPPDGAAAERELETIARVFHTMQPSARAR